MTSLITAKGSINGNGQSAVRMSVSQHETFAFDLSGTFVGTVQVQVSADGTNWRNVTSSSSILNMVTGAYISAGNVTAGGLYAISVAASRHVRLTSTAFTSGTIVINAMASTASVVDSGTAPRTISGTVTANEGTKATGTNYNLITTASTNLGVVRNAAANLRELTISNPTATIAYVKLYNKTTNPVLATDVPVMTIPVAGTSMVAVPLGEIGKRFATGIAISVTAGMAANDSASTVAGIQVNGTYI